MFTASTLNLWAESWTRFLINSLIDATVVLIAVSLLWLFIHKKASAQLGYSLFLLVLLKLLLPIEITVPAWLADLSPTYSVNRAVTSGFPSLLSTNQEEVAATRPKEPAIEVSTVTAETGNQVPGVSRFEPLTLPGMLMIGWSAVVLFLLGWFLFVQWKTRRIFLRSTEIEPESLPVDFERLKEQVGVRREVPLLTNPVISLPATWGILRSRLILPVDLATTVSPQQLSWIILHELAHIRRSDLLVTLFQRILQILFFFNPAVWIANWVADQLREYACDDIALSTCDAPRKDCGKGFLSLLERVNNLPTVMTAPLGMLNYNTVIKRRMFRILDAGRTLRVGLSAGALALLLPLALILLPSLRADEESMPGTEIIRGSSGKPTFRKIRIPANPGNGVLSPDGEKLAFASEGSLWVVPVSGKVRPNLVGEPVRLTEPMGVWNRCNLLSWSADGRWIAFNTLKEQESAVYVIPSSGGIPKKVAANLLRGNHIYRCRIALSPNGKLLAYTAEDSNETAAKPTRLGHFRLYTIPVDGEKPTRLTDSWSSEPVFSPDGEWIVYRTARMTESKDNYTTELWAVPAGGGEPIQITDLEVRARGPIWSPDGKMLAFSFEPGKDNTSDAVWIVTFNESGPPSDALVKIKLPRENLDLLSGWTPDDKLGIFILSPRHHAIYTVPASGGKATQISPEGYPCHPRWAPDGKRVFFRGIGGIASVPAEGGKREVVPFRDAPKIVEVLPGGGNHISPDGSTILFCAYEEGTDPLEVGLWTVPVQGGEPQKIELDIPARYPCWSSDGKMVSFITSTEGPNGAWMHNICVVPSGGGKAEQISTPEDQVAYSRFSWSPDGKWIAYFSTKKEIRLLPAGGGKSQFLTTVNFVHSHKELCWSPDASKIAYTERGHMMVVPIASGETREIKTGVLTEKVKNFHLDWSPDGKKLAFSAELGGGPEPWFIEDFLSLAQAELD